jgi:hypothetical protein
MYYISQNDLLLNRLLEYYKNNNYHNMNKMLGIINGTSRISLRIIDWFTTNYAKKHYTVYNLKSKENRFKVYNDYKLKLKAYSKKRFDPFCRWDRITIPYKDNFIQTTIGQLNFFKWAIENGVVKYIEDNYSEIESDMNIRNSSAKKKNNLFSKTRKKREELSISATRSIKKEDISITIIFN